MAIGKKFDAAEKHFRKIEEKHQRRIKNFESIVVQLQTDLSRLADENGRLISENESLQQWVERLLTSTELSKEDIIAACEHDKKRDEALISLANMMRGLRNYI